MANKFAGRGNLGAEPQLRYTPEPDSVPVCALRVFFDRPKPDGDGQFADKGGFWMDVRLWGARAETASRLLHKGARVAVTGELHEETWQDKTSGEERSKLCVRATYVDLDLTRLDSATWQARTEEAA